MSEDTINLCLLSDPYLTEYQVNSLENVVESSNVEISLVVVNDPDSMEYDPKVEATAVNSLISLSMFELFLDVLGNEKWWTFVIAEKKIAELLGLVPTNQQHAISEIGILEDTEVLKPPLYYEGDWIEFPSEVISKVHASSDIAILYGFGLIRGGILDAPQYGVLSFHPADIRDYRGLGPPQVYLDEKDEIGLTLQRLTNQIDGGDIIGLNRIDITSCNTLWDIYEAIYESQISMLADGIQSAIDSSGLPTKPTSLGRYYSIDNRRELFFALKVVRKNFIGHIKNGIG